MGKLFQPGKVVVVLQGRFAGRKAVVVRSSDKDKDAPFGRCLLAGIDRYPRKVNKRMSKKLIGNRSRIRPFLKVYNQTHILPTRFSLDLRSELKGKVNITEPSKKKQSKRHVRRVFQERYSAGKHRWFFTPLRF